MRGPGPEPVVEEVGLELFSEEPSKIWWLNREKEMTKLTSGLCMMHSTCECGWQVRNTVDGWMWKVRVTSTGKVMGEGERTSLSSAAAVSVSSASDSELLELEMTVAAIVGRATCSMNSRKLCVNLMSSGSDSMTAQRESTPLFTGRWGKGDSGGSKLLAGRLSVGGW